MLRGGGTEDALLSLVHIAHPIGGGCEQRVQMRVRHGHILVGSGEGEELPLHLLHRLCLVYPKR
jgi:hypothetical protein